MQKYFCGGCYKEIPIVIGVNQLHICSCGTLNNVGDDENNENDRTKESGDT